MQTVTVKSPDGAIITTEFLSEVLAFIRRELAPITHSEIVLLGRLAIALDADDYRLARTIAEQMYCSLARAHIIPVEEARTDTIGGYIIRIDPMQDLDCEACQ